MRSCDGIPEGASRWTVGGIFTVVLVLACCAGTLLAGTFGAVATLMFGTRTIITIAVLFGLAVVGVVVLRRRWRPKNPTEPTPLSPSAATARTRE